MLGRPQIAFVGTQLDQVKAVALVIGDGVGTNLFQLARQAAINSEVVGGELDHGLLPRMQEGNVLRTNARFDQQGVIQRHDLDQIAARLHNPANGIDQQLLDDATHR